MSYHEVPLVVTDAMVTMMLANIHNVQNSLGPFEITDADLKTVPKMGPRRFVFSVEAHQYARIFPTILFYNRGVASYDLVKSNFEKLAPVFKELNKLHTMMKVIVHVLGSNTYQHGLSTYEAINASNNDGVPGIEFARKALAVFFKGQGVQTEPPTEEGDIPFIPGSNGPVTGGPAPDPNA